MPPPSVHRKTSREPGTHRSSCVDTGSSEGYWLNCKFKLSSKGKFYTDRSSCKFDTGEKYTVKGRIKVNSNCRVDPVTITFYDDTPAVIFRSILNFGIVDKGKSVMHGLGDAGTSEPFIFSAVKG
jgi:hypothetical protein